VALAAIIHEYEPYQLPVSPSAWLDSLDKMLGDLQFTCNVNELALAHSMHGGDTYYYYFTHRASQQTWPNWMGVLHGYEINFIFGEPFNTRRFKYSAEEQELSRRFMRYWANFARTGNPNKNPDGTFRSDRWPLYTPSKMEYLNLTVESDYEKGAHRTGSGPRRKQCAFWKSYLPSLMSATGDIGDAYVRWKQQLDRWEKEYMTDWQLHFEQYKRYQTYRQADQDEQDCS